MSREHWVSVAGFCWCCGRPVVLREIRDRLGLFERDQHHQLCPHVCPEAAVDAWWRGEALRRFENRAGRKSRDEGSPGRSSNQGRGLKPDPGQDL